MLDLPTIFRSGRPALMPFLVAGHPDPASSEQLLDAVVEGGADLIELGIPYSDPLADGPVIQAAAQKALGNGTNLAAVFAIAARFTSRHAVPLVLFTYYNPVFRYGSARFVEKAKASGVQGLIVPDLPVEEAGDLQALCSAAGLDLIYLVAPTSSRARQERILQQAESFVYVVSTTGVTGERQALGAKLTEQLAELRQMGDQPLAVGFGISNPEQAAQVAAWGADGIVIGSAFVRLIEAAGPEAVGRLRERVREFRLALDGVGLPAART